MLLALRKSPRYDGGFLMGGVLDLVIGQLESCIHILTFFFLINTCSHIVLQEIVMFMKLACLKYFKTLQLNLLDNVR